MLELLSLRKGTTLTKEMFLNHLYDFIYNIKIVYLHILKFKLFSYISNILHTNCTRVT